MRRSPARWLLLPLVPVYAGVVAAKNWLYDRGVLKPKRMRHSVISVGSYSAGGAGKTPVVMMLAELFAREGLEVRILTRGYGRSGTGTEQVCPDGAATRYGDEPLMMARNLPQASVFVATDRFLAGMLAARSDGPQTKAVYLLDDGFQHRKLARDVDLVLVTKQDLEDWPLPAGNLRESLKALRRADVILVREDEAEVETLVREKLAGTSTAVWVAKRQLVIPEGAKLLARPIVFCALARPERFVRMLREMGVEPVAVEMFRDHHAYSQKDIHRLVERARQHQADGFLTTEKDAVKLSVTMVARLEAVGPVVVPRLQVELVDTERATVDLMALMSARGTRNHSAA